MTNNREIVLASASPRRKQLLERIGLQFTVEPSEYQEEIVPGLSPEELVKAISLGKALTAAKKHPDAVIIAADTIGVLRGRIIGKPHTPEKACQTLRQLSGKSHRVITGLTIFDAKYDKLVSRSVETRVYFKRLSDQEIVNYVNSGESLDKAGAYAIQGLGAVIVEKIAGDYYNVMGLPLNALAECLIEFGIRVL